MSQDPQNEGSLDVNETVRLIMAASDYSLDKHGTHDHLCKTGKENPLELIELAKQLNVEPIIYKGSGEDIHIPLD